MSRQVSEWKTLNWRRGGLQQSLDDFRKENPATLTELAEIFKRFSAYPKDC